MLLSALLHSAEAAVALRIGRERAVELLHKYGVSAQTVTWTEGTNAEVHKKLWDIGFDHFTSDYPEFFNDFAKTIRK